MNKKEIWKAPEIREIVEETAQENVDGNVAYLCNGGYTSCGGS